MEIHDIKHYHEAITSLTTDEGDNYIKIGEIWYWSIGESLETEYTRVDLLEKTLKDYYGNRD